jgi:putative cardiolipin synthase
MADLNPESSKSMSLASGRAALQAAAEQVKASRYASDLRNDEIVKQLTHGELALQWLTDYQLVADDPLKLNATDVFEQSAVLSVLLPHMQHARQDLTIASPYFVPGKSGTELLVGLAQRGVSVKILTNSLAANDVAAVYGGYSRYRESLLKGGVQLWELKPRGSVPGDFSLAGSSGASLHAKTLSIDDAAVFVGSYNLDSRSTRLNAEMGVYVDDSVLASRFDELFKQHTSGAFAWRVTMANGAVSWTDGTETFNSSPRASTWRRFQAWLTRVLHMDPQL